MTQTLERRPDAVPASVGRGRQHVRILIIGGGFAGLGAAIKLAEHGQHDYVVVERGSDVGGTWRDNTYPGAACDVPSHLYSYSFALNPNWTRSFSPQPEIQQYLRETAARYGVLDRLRFDTEVTRAEWDNAQQRWLVDTTTGDYTTDVLVPAIGALCEPSLPNIPGIETFTGHVFHSARWNHEVSLAGKRVAVIGTGASAVQIVPAIADTVAHLDVYQRTPGWVVPRRDRAYSAVERFAYRSLPGVQKAARQAIYWAREGLVLGFAYQPKVLSVARRAAEKNISSGIADPQLRAAVTPEWQIGCKRILISNDWYPTLARDDVDLVTSGIAEVRPNAIVDRNGTVREVDAIVVATGFQVTNSPAFDRIIGATGESLGEHWRATGQQAYKGAAVAGFPNLLFLVGPNTGLGHTSMIHMIESQVNYLVDAVTELDRRDISTFEVRAEAQREYNDTLQARMRRTIWTTGGCASWYLDEHGNNTTLWPGFTFAFRRLTRRFDLEAYHLTRRSARRLTVVTEDSK